MSHDVILNIGRFDIGIISLSRSLLSERFFNYCEDIFREIKLQRPALNVKRIIIDDCNAVSHKEQEEIKSVDILLTYQKVFRNKSILQHLDHIKWIHTFTTGIDLLVNIYANKPPPKFVLTRNAGHFDMQMVQYVIGCIISREQKFEQYRLLQSQRIWNRISPRLLETLTVGIVGFGSIGKKIAEYALKFQMKTMALLKKDKSVPTDLSNELQNVVFTNDLVNLLESCDYIVSVLPKVTSTNGVFDGDILKHCRDKKSVFINIGRGNVISEEAVIKALNEGWLSHAILDVFETEPLPKESPLWGRGDVTITPHVSGSELVAEKFVKDTLQKYDQFCAGQPLEHQVDFTRGY